MKIFQVYNSFQKYVDEFREWMKENPNGSCYTFDGCFEFPTESHIEERNENYPMVCYTGTFFSDGNQIHYCSLIVSYSDLLLAEPGTTIFSFTISGNQINVVTGDLSYFL